MMHHASCTSALTACLIAALLLPLTALAATVRLSIVPSPALPNLQLLPPLTAATLTTAGTVHRALVQRDARAVFRNVTAGSYLLEVVAPSHVFAPLRVDVDEASHVRAWQTFRGNVWANTGAEVAAMPELVLGAGATREYLVSREGFNPLKMLMNPMILIAVVSLGTIYFLPKMMDNMDPEMKEEFEKRQKKAPSAASINPAANFDIASYLAGTSSPAAGGSAGGKKR